MIPMVPSAHHKQKNNVPRPPNHETAKPEQPPNQCGTNTMKPKHQLHPCALALKSRRRQSVAVMFTFNYDQRGITNTSAECPRSIAKNINFTRNNTDQRITATLPTIAGHITHWSRAFHRTKKRAEASLNTAGLTIFSRAPP